MMTLKLKLKLDLIKNKKHHEYVLKVIEKTRPWKMLGNKLPRIYHWKFGIIKLPYVPVLNCQ